MTLCQGQVEKEKTLPLKKRLLAYLPWGYAMLVAERSEIRNAERTWPQLVCCALITPSVLISEGEYRDDQNGTEREE